MTSSALFVPFKRLSVFEFSPYHILRLSPELLEEVLSRAVSSPAHNQEQRVEEKQEGGSGMRWSPSILLSLAGQ